MNKKIQRLSLSITNIGGTDVNEFTKDFLSEGKKLLGMSIKSGIPGDSLVDVKVKGRTIVEGLPVDALMCNEDYVSPDTRFNTLFPDSGDISKEEIFIKVSEDGTAGAYPYDMTVLLLLEVQ